MRERAASLRSGRVVLRPTPPSQPDADSVTSSPGHRGRCRRGFAITVRVEGPTIASEGHQTATGPFVYGVCAVVAWGVLAFGAVYPWAYWPLLLGAATTGLYGLCAFKATNRDGGAASRSLFVGLSMVTVAGFAQLVPMSRAGLQRVSPATVDMVGRFSPPFETVAAVAHPISINPGATGIALTCLVALGLFLLGLASALSAGRQRNLVAGIVSLGVVVALAGIVQRALGTDEIYGFWAPRYVGQMFAPFVNRNHFAGWMAMTLSLALGDFGGRMAGAMTGVKPGWRARLLWMSSPAANQIVLVAIAIAVMSIALVLTLSRSGFVCLVLALILSAWLFARRLTGHGRRAASLAFLAFVVVNALTRPETDAIASKLSDLSWLGPGGRWGAWMDALRVGQDFWLTGTGLNTFSDVMVVYQRRPGEHLAQAHSDYLQLVAEGGLLVCIPVVITVALLVREVRRRFRENKDDVMTSWIRVGACTGLLAIALQEVVEFSLQMPGNAVLFCVLTAIAVHRAPRGATRPTGSLVTE